MWTDTKNELLASGRLLFRSLLVIGLVVVMICVSIAYFDQHLWLALAVQSAVTIVVYKLYRWARWPGMWHSRSATRKLRDTALSVLLFWVSPVLVVLERFHLREFVPLREIAASLDLAFPIHIGEEVQVVSVAAPEYFPREWGVVKNVRVVTLNDAAQAPVPLGSLLYRLRFRNGAEVEVPAVELIPPD